MLEKNTCEEADILGPVAEPLKPRGLGTQMAKDVAAKTLIFQHRGVCTNTTDVGFKPTENNANHSGLGALWRPVDGANVLGLTLPWFLAFANIWP